MTDTPRARQAAQQRDRRRAYKALGRCSQCGQPRDRANRLTCAKCANLDPHAAALRAADQVAYWLAFSYQDGLALLAGTVPPDVRRQAQRLLKREPTEGADEYAARVAEATA